MESPYIVFKKKVWEGGDGQIDRNAFKRFLGAPTIKAQRLRDAKCVVEKTRCDFPRIIGARSSAHEDDLSLTKTRAPKHFAQLIQLSLIVCIVVLKTDPKPSSTSSQPTFGGVPLQMKRNPLSDLNRSSWKTNGVVFPTRDPSTFSRNGVPLKTSSGLKSGSSVPSIGL